MQGHAKKAKDLLEQVNQEARSWRQDRRILTEFAPPVVWVRSLPLIPGAFVPRLDHW